MMKNSNNKRHRSFGFGEEIGDLSSTYPVVYMESSDGSLAEVSQSNSARSSSPNVIPPTIPGGFNDPTTADAILRLYSEKVFPFESNCEISEDSELELYVHSSVLRRRSKYFSALFSDQWAGDGSNHQKLNLEVDPGSGSIQNHVAVIQLLYTSDFAAVINSVSSALSILPVALKLLFEDCVKECVRLLESVHWSKEEEDQIMVMIPLLGEDESNSLRARVSAPTSEESERTLECLITTGLQSSNVDTAIGFLSSLLKDFPSREAAIRALNRSFSHCLNSAKPLLESTNLINLEKVVTECEHSIWLIELRAADSAVREWSEQAWLASGLQKGFSKFKTIQSSGYQHPGIPAKSPTKGLRCISKVMDWVANGTVLAPAEVRKQLVANWLPVMVACKQGRSSAPGYEFASQGVANIISTLPAADAQDLVIRCFPHSTADSETCSLMLQAAQMLFRRAKPPPS